jgi:hypothetical protein
VGKFRKSETVEIGGFDLIKLGTLLQFEEAWIEKHLARQADLVSLPALEFAQYLVDTEKLSEQAATERLLALESSGNTGMMVFLLKYRKEIPEIIEALIDAPKVKAKSPAQIACFVLQNRLPSGYVNDHRNELLRDLNIVVGDKEEWQPEWIDLLDVDTVSRLYEFFMLERLGWQTVAVGYSGVEEEGLTLGEESPPSAITSPPTGETGGPQSGPLVSATPSLTGPSILSVPSV